MPHVFNHSDWVEPQLRQLLEVASLPAACTLSSVICVTYGIPTFGLHKSGPLVSVVMLPRISRCFCSHHVRRSPAEATTAPLGGTITTTVRGGAWM